MNALPKQLVSAVLLALFVVSVQARWHHGDLTTAIHEAKSVEAAVELAQEALTRQGYEVVLTVNHAAAAESVSLELRPTQLILALPPAYIERAILRRSQTVGIDLPIKILIFEDEQGSIRGRTNPLGYLTDRHSITLRDHVLRTLARAAAPFAEPDDGLITLTSKRPMEDTISALSEAIDTAGGFRIPLILQYGDGRQRAKPVLIVFGNPNAGTPLMQASQEIALDLPQKFLVWEEQNGVVHITYNDPFYIAKRHNLQGQEARLDNISNALANFAAVGAGK